MKPDIEKYFYQIIDELNFLKLEIGELKSLLSEKVVGEDCDLLTVNQVSLEFSVNPGLIYNACAEGKIKFEKRGRAYRFKRENVVKWIDEMQGKEAGRTVAVNDIVTKYLQVNRRNSG